jgi:hypothetical protein
MLTKRIIPCLDVRNKKVTKGVKFQNNVDLGDPIEMAFHHSHFLRRAATQWPRPARSLTGTRL